MTSLTHPLRISVLAAPLAAIDRRTLSQAWYSALELGSSKTRVQTPHPAASNRPRDAVRPNVTHDAMPRHRTSTQAPSNAAHGRRADIPGDSAVSAPRSAVERRSASQLARRIERKIASPAFGTRTTLRLDGAQGRVHLVIQRHGDTLRLIAICRRDARESVARALSHARYALAKAVVSCT